MTLDEALEVAKDTLKKDFPAANTSEILNKDYLVISKYQYPILEEKGRDYAEVYLIEFKGYSLLIDANTRELIFIDLEKSS
ncbi:MAG: hypothetical protein Q4E50_07215 [Tissierellia bacterium]|nr:hypothetical protein [Tissierellia bacterium]